MNKPTSHAPKHPLLYSFRRCPYAIRARMALCYAGIDYQLREVDLRAKPPSLSALSAKATVPVLQLPSGQVIDESIEIIYYALNQHDPDQWLCREEEAKINTLITYNDQQFKPILDRFKYPSRYPQCNQKDHQKQGDLFLTQLNHLLKNNGFLFCDRLTIADIAIFPFIRQWSGVNTHALSRFPYLKQWLTKHSESLLFQSIMKKHPVWQDS